MSRPQVSLTVLERRAMRNAIELCTSGGQGSQRRLMAWEKRALEKVAAKIPAVKI